MKTFIQTAILLQCVGLSQAWAKQPVTSEPPQPSATISPDVWIYQQEMVRYDDPRTAVRRKAEFAAAQRQRRIAARKWFGFSNLRPVANPTPFGTMYSPAWISNTGLPYGWSGTSRYLPYFP